MSPIIIYIATVLIAGGSGFYISYRFNQSDYAATNRSGDFGSPRGGIFATMSGMLIGMIALSLLLGRFMLRSQPLYSSRVVHFVAASLLILAPLALAGMTAMGYHYTAVKLAERFIDSLYLIVLWMLVEGTVVRNLNVAGRRLAYQRAVAKREAAQAREGQQETEVAVEIPEMNLQQILLLTQLMERPLQP